MARSGLRMMPTFPSSPLRFRTASFPQYGSKAGLSVGAFPSACRLSPLPACPVRSRVCVRRSRPPWPHQTLAQSRGSRLGVTPPCERHPPLYPRGPRSGPGCSVPVHRRLIGPPHSRARRVFPAVPVMLDAFAVRERLGDPRVVPCFRCPLFPDMPSSTPPECSSAACSQMVSSPTTMDFAQVFEARRARRPRHPLRAGILFRGLLVRLRSWTFAPACPFARPPGGSDRCAGTPTHQPTRAFTSALSPGWSPFPTADMTTVLPGRATPAGLSPARTSASIAAQYSTYSTDEQRRQRAKDQAKWLQNVAVEALERRTG